MLPVPLLLLVWIMTHSVLAVATRPMCFMVVGCVGGRTNKQNKGSWLHKVEGVGTSPGELRLCPHNSSLTTGGAQADTTAMAFGCLSFYGSRSLYWVNGWSTMPSILHNVLDSDVFAYIRGSIVLVFNHGH